MNRIIKLLMYAWLPTSLFQKRRPNANVWFDFKRVKLLREIILNKIDPKVLESQLWLTHVQLQ